MSGKNTIGLKVADSWRIPFVTLLMFFCFLQGVKSNTGVVQIHVQPTVTVEPSDSEAIIPCNFTTDGSTNYHIIWESIDKNHALVINSELGNVFKGKHYNDTPVYMKDDSCTLVFPEPRETYSGNYSVKVFIPGVGKAHAPVQVIIKPRSNTTLDGTTPGVNVAVVVPPVVVVVVILMAGGIGLVYRKRLLAFLKAITTKRASGQHEPVPLGPVIQEEGNCRAY